MGQPLNQHGQQKHRDTDELDEEVRGLHDRALKPEINKRAEIRSVQRGDTAQVCKDSNNPNDDMLFVVVFGGINLFLKLLSEFGEGDERKEDSHDEGDTEMWMDFRRESAEVESEHPADVLPGQTDVLDAKEDP